MYIVLYMGYSRKRSSKKSSKKSASKKSGKAKTLRKKGSRKNIKKVSGGFLGLFGGPKKLVIKSGTQIYNMVKETYNAEIHNKEGDFKRFDLIKGDMVTNAAEKGFPTNLNYILIACSDTSWLE